MHLSKFYVILNTSKQSIIVNSFFYFQNPCLQIRKMKQKQGCETIEGSIPVSLWWLMPPWREREGDTYERKERAGSSGAKP